jgi:hypothetical protein
MVEIKNRIKFRFIEMNPHNFYDDSFDDSDEMLVVQRTYDFRPPLGYNQLSDKIFQREFRFAFLKTNYLQFSKLKFLAFHADKWSC